MGEHDMNLKTELNPFPSERTKAYGVISDNEKIDETLYSITVDLVNEKMISFDNDYIFSQNADTIDLHKNPKDYLYVYFMTITVNYETYSRHFSIQEYNSFYEYELIPISQYNKSNDSNAILCDVYFSASPISEIKYYIKIMERVFKFH